MLTEQCSVNTVQNEEKRKKRILNLKKKMKVTKGAGSSYICNLLFLDL